MNITISKIVPINHEKVKAVVSIALDGDIVIHGLKLLEGKNGLWVAWPRSSDRQGVFHDIVHPTNEQSREALSRMIIDAYKKQTGRQTK